MKQNPPDLPNPPSASAQRPTAAVARLWGCNDLDAVFHGADLVMLPWQRLPRGPRIPLPGPLPVAPPRLEAVDPRILWATQPKVVRHHAAYYLTGSWERTGITSADMNQPVNRYPAITVGLDGRHVIRTGHHRSLTALIEGRPVLARVHHIPVPQEPDFRLGNEFVVTPLLRVAMAQGGDQWPLGSEASRELAYTIESGRAAVATSFEIAGEILTLLGLDEGQRNDRIHMARTGNILGAR